MFKKQKISSFRPLTAVFTAVIGLTIGWVAGDVQSVSSSSAGYSVCVSKSNGTMRLASVKKCSSAEKKILLGAEGPMGAQGPAGLPGTAGVAGAKGVDGAAGAKGADATVQTETWRFTFLSDSCPIGFAPEILGGLKLYKGTLFSSDYLTSSFNWSNSWYKCTASIKSVK